MNTATPTGTPGQIKVWDPFIRIFHWSLAGFFLIAFITEDDWLYLHSFAGYAILALLAFRVCWGLIGTRYARFSSFVFPLATVRDYLRSLLSGSPRHYLGHNPAGGLMILVMLVLLLLTCLSGVATLAAEGLGPLANTWVAGLPEHWLEEVHEVLANLMLLMVIVHLGGVVVSSLLHKENLVKAMLNGRKTLKPEDAL